MKPSNSVDAFLNIARFDPRSDFAVSLSRTDSPGFAGRLRSCRTTAELAELLSAIGVPGESIPAWITRANAGENISERLSVRPEALQLFE
jgi:hypothetical protein